MEPTVVEPTQIETNDQQFPLFSALEFYDHEQLVICSEPDLGLKAIIAVHDTTLGPALGGTRMWPYENEQEAIRDVLRLSRGMTYKASISGLNLGGGKAVIIGDHRKDKDEMLFRSYGRYVDSLGGRYITAEDVGMNVQDMEWISMETKYVTGLSKDTGGGGNPSPVTAHGVYMGMKASAQKAYGSDSLKDKKIAIQGAGAVSSYLAKYLAKEEAKLFICDIYDEKAHEVAHETGAEVVSNEDIYGLDVDIFSPCALGGVINNETVPQFKCDIIAGCANNVLEDEEQEGQILVDKNILYAPDYVINAGGLINVASELEGYNEQRALDKATRIYDTILNIYNYSEDNDVTTLAASNHLAEERIRKVGNINKVYTSESQFSGHIGEMYKAK